LQLLHAAALLLCHPAAYILTQAWLGLVRPCFWSQEHAKARQLEADAGMLHQLMQAEPKADVVAAGCSPDVAEA